jgi:hypothetical protein
MRRLFRLVLLCLLALALPLQGATAAAAMAGGHGAATMPAADHAAMAMADGAPCPHHAAAAKQHAGHAIERAGCGACCGPAVAEHQPLLAVAPAPTRWTMLAAAPALAQRTQFLTGGPDRPPRAA